MDIAELELQIARESDLELQFWAQCKREAERGLLPLPEWHAVLFGFETDFTWPDIRFRFVVQIQGGVEDGSGRSRGAHVRKAGYHRDRQLSNVAQVAGWKVFEFIKPDLDDNSAIEFVCDYIRLQLAELRKGKDGTTDT